MKRERKLKSPVTLFAAIEAAQHESLRRLAFDERRSLADLVREAIAAFLESKALSSKGRKRASSTAR